MLYDWRGHVIARCPHLQGVFVVRFVLVALLAFTCACNRSGTSAATAAASPAAAAAPAQPAAPKPVPAVLPDVLARVNGESVTKAEFEAAVASIEQQNGGTVPAEQRDRVFRGVLDQLVGLKLLAQEVKARN